MAHQRSLGLDVNRATVPQDYNSYGLSHLVQQRANRPCAKSSRKDHVRLCAGQFIHDGQRNPLEGGMVLFSVLMILQHNRSDPIYNTKFECALISFSKPSPLANKDRAIRNQLRELSEYRLPIVRAKHHRKQPRDANVLAHEVEIRNHVRSDVGRTMHSTLSR